ncbi:peptide/nickel transport system permease protein [Microbacterium sp. SORGH_AS 1204]|uniref:ABC transporter permease n=1 Tax=Microbacterium sp. SORGH_AS_1204 TaxID=3041785 RepID=UPI00279097BB|nr:ABC transporter permease [Microbacterium sp. SORGH_AS_1204]MDQ1135266.1 peptide/nickel transport system permease protein [Microbacterium sp. SORGH_AS_1204]
MLSVIGRRLAIAVPLVLLVSLLTFLLVPLIPGDPAATILGNTATPAQLASLREALGLDRPLFERYLDWLTAALRGDFGSSFYDHSPVLETIAARIPVTLSLTLAATLLSLIVGVGLGVLAAVRGGVVDRAVQLISVVGMALPNFWLALVLVLCLAIWVPIFLPSGYVPFEDDPNGWLRSLTLPTIALGLASATAIALQTRASLTDLARRDFVRILRAKGVSRTSIITKHLLRNASGPILTVTGLQFVGMLGGAVVIEQVFALPGLGSLIFASVSKLDVPLMQGVVVVMTLLVVAVNLLTDLVSAWLNPKLR